MIIKNFTAMSKENKQSIAITYLFIFAVIGIKIAGIAIAASNSDGAIQCAYDSGGYLDPCTTNADCFTGYICGTDQMCYCDDTDTSVPVVNTGGANCTNSDQCLNRQVCSIETNQCEYPSICQDEDEKITGMTLSTWLLIYSIIGIVACSIGIVFVCMEQICCDDDDCFEGTCLVISWCVGITYLIFSVAWNIFGWVILFGTYEGCKETAPTLWYYSLFNCIILYVLIVLNPITFELYRDCRCQQRCNKCLGD